MKLLDSDIYWKESRGDRQESSGKAYIAALVAGTSALRSGEIRSLRREDIGEDVLYVRHNYNNFDGLKKPKNNEEQPVYLLPKVRTLLLSLLDKSPHTGIDLAKQFVFWSADPEKPISAQTVLKYFHCAVKRAEIDLSGRKVDLHSLRHYVATAWANETGDLRQVAIVTRHKDLRQAARYSDHTYEREVAEMGKTAAKILNFAKEA
jgi:integrase